MKNSQLFECITLSVCVSIITELKYSMQSFKKLNFFEEVKSSVGYIIC